MNLNYNEITNLKSTFIYFGLIRFNFSSVFNKLLPLSWNRFFCSVVISFHNFLQLQCDANNIIHMHKLFYLCYGIKQHLWNKIIFTPKNMHRISLKRKTTNKKKIIKMLKLWDAFKKFENLKDKRNKLSHMLLRKRSFFAKSLEIKKNSKVLLGFKINSNSISSWCVLEINFSILQNLKLKSQM